MDPFQFAYKLICWLYSLHFLNGQWHKICSFSLQFQNRLIMLKMLPIGWFLSKVMIWVQNDPPPIATTPQVLNIKSRQWCSRWSEMRWHELEIRVPYFSSQKPRNLVVDYHKVKICSGQNAVIYLFWWKCSTVICLTVFFTTSMLWFHDPC